ncbi:unnamed protein product [Cyprideis torosa]|uniref:Uncharacterized protein n=1 Tax=Cyprideis torosa TaxID=163714 RepID=A0A7R8ZHI3_9CRUS|nr:unnamed protein product [Cyprideis torosa]CAG0882582.1 unnamed protein product [Cyprideis torosa]
MAKKTSIFRKLYHHIIGSALSKVAIEGRTEKALERAKKVAEAAPKFEADKARLESIRTEHPEIIKTLQEKNETLLSMLSKVYVTSQDIPVDPYRKELKKPLPQSRAYHPEEKFGYRELEHTAKGKVSLKNVVEFISKHRADHTTWTSQRIADEYRLDPKRVENILRHFAVLAMIYHPEAKKTRRGRAVLFDAKAVPYLSVVEELQPHKEQELQYTLSSPDTGNKTEETEEKQPVDDVEEKYRQKTVDEAEEEYRQQHPLLTRFRDYVQTAGEPPENKLKKKGIDLDELYERSLEEGMRRKKSDESS